MAGCVVLIGRRAGIVFEQAYGNRSVEPDVVPMTTDTVFDMASLTKPTRHGHQRDDPRRARQVAAHGQGGRLLSRVRRPRERRTSRSSICSTHTSGLIPDNPLKDYEDGWKSAAPLIFDLKPLSPPGTEFKYSDINFILLGKIVEKVAGKPVNEFAKEEIYSKLGMTETGYLPSAELQDRAATTEKNEGRWLKGEVHDPRAAKMGGVAGHAGLFSTAEDMAVYAQMMLQQGEYGGVRVMSAGDRRRNDPRPRQRRPTTAASAGTAAAAIPAIGAS